MDLLKRIYELARSFKEVYKIPLHEAQYLAIGYFYFTNKTELNNYILKDDIFEKIKKEETTENKSIIELFVNKYWNEINLELSELEKDLLCRLQSNKEKYNLEKIMKLYSSDNIYLINEILKSLENKGIITIEEDLWYRELNKTIRVLPLGKIIIKKVKENYGNL